ncbi:MAG: hypothetical protein LBG95_03605 [Treponema sp.]|jgi:hypothetical protein|nr:hypothetical protein [Treponema sp.]
MINKFLFALITVVAVSLPVFGASLEELAGVERAAALRGAAEPITETQYKAPSPHLMPRHGELGHFIAELQKSLEPNILVETLSLYHKPSTAVWDDAEQTRLLNHLAALSTLTGIQYYSASRKAMRVFYESSFVIDNPAAQNPLPDPVYAALPASLTLYALQKDLTFGNNIFSFTFHTGKDYILYVQENLSAMNAGIIPAIGKNKFRCLVAVIDAGDSLLIYAAAMAKSASIPGMGDRIGVSFTNRVKAVINWFEMKAVTK